jgi:hypothetical protein
MISAGDMGLVIRMFVSTGAVLGLLLFMARLARRGRLDGLLSRVRGGATLAAPVRRGPGSAPTKTMRILNKQSVSRESVILQIQFGNEEMLVAVCASSATVLARSVLDDGVVEPAVSPGSRAAVSDADSFSDAFALARQTSNAEDAVAGALVGTSLVERLRNATTVRTNPR